MKYSLYNEATNIPATLWIPRERSLLDIFDVCSRLAVDFGSFGVNVKESNIAHDIAGCVVFSGRTFGAGEIVGQ